MAEFINRKSCYIGKNVKIGKNVVIYENNHLEGNVVIGDNTTLLPNNLIINSTIGQDCTIHASVIESSTVCNSVTIGPYAHLRPNSKIEDGCKIGNFVEIKNSHIGKNCKISHLAYVGDCEMGKDCNIGCGVIFANYDGRAKHRSNVGNHVFVGSNCNIIAPVNLASDTYICSGTTVTKDTKPKDFVIGRARQENKADMAEKYW